MGLAAGACQGAAGQLAARTVSLGQAPSCTGMDSMKLECRSSVVRLFLHSGSVQLVVAEEKHAAPAAHMFPISKGMPVSALLSSLRTTNARSCTMLGGMTYMAQAREQGSSAACRCSVLLAVW
jgi:hypothetical protein